MARASNMRIVPGGCVYRGADINTKHAGHSLQLLMPLEGQLDVLVEGVRYQLPAGASLLIPANCEQQILASAPRVTVMLDPEGPRAPYRAFATPGAVMVLSGAVGRRMHAFAAEVDGAALADAAAVEAVLASAESLLVASGVGGRRGLDPRVGAALELFRMPWLGLSHRAVARRAAIAPDRLSHLFSEQLGISAKRYALWIRSVAAIEQMGRGRSATAAARLTRFSDLAHFSRAARRYHGLPPSRLPIAGMRVFAGAYGSEQSLGASQP